MKGFQLFHGLDPMSAAPSPVLIIARTTGGSQMVPTSLAQLEEHGTGDAEVQPYRPSCFSHLARCGGHYLASLEALWKFGSLTASWDKLWGLHLTPSFLRGIKLNSLPRYLCLKFYLCLTPSSPLFCMHHSLSFSRSPLLINHLWTNTHLRNCFWKTDVRQLLPKW